MGLSFPPLGAHACAARGPAAAGCELAAVPHSCAQQWVRSGTPHTVLNRQRPCPIRCRRHWPPLQRNAHTPARSGAESEREKREQASPKERALGCPPRATRATRRAHRLVGLGQPGPTKRLWPHRAMAKLGFSVARQIGSDTAPRARCREALTREEWPAARVSLRTEGARPRGGLPRRRRGKGGRKASARCKCRMQTRALLDFGRLGVGA